MENLEQEKTPEELKLEQEDKLEKLLTQTEELKNDSNVLNKIMADPDILKIIQMKDKGLDVDIQEKKEMVEDENSPLEPDLDPNLNLDDMTNTEFASYLTKTFQKSLGSLVDAKLAPVAQELDGINSFVRSSNLTTAEKELEELKAKHADAEVYFKEMSKLSEASPQLGLEQLYVLAKLSQGKLQIEQPATAVELPTVSSFPRKQRKVPLPRGRQGIKQLLREATER